MRELNLDHLHTFANVVDLKSFSAAAVRLNLTQPAVSLQIRQLERRLGIRLLERVGKKARPTPAGQEFLRYVHRIEAAITDAMGAMAQYRADGIGRVRLGTGATACIYVLPPILRDLRTRYPGLEIIVRTGNTPDILRGVEENTVDIALVTLPAPGRMFQVTPVMDEEQMAIFPAEGLPPPPKVTPAVLMEWPLVLYEAEGHSRRLINDWFLSAGLVPKPIMELGSVEAIKELVGAGLGCAVLPSLAVTGSGARDAFLARPLSPPLRRQLGLVLRRDKVLDASLRAVIDSISVSRNC